MRQQLDYDEIKWMGDIPKEWNCGKVKHGFYRKNEKAMQENPVILSLARSGVRVRDISNNEGQIAESYYNYNPVNEGDLLLNPMDLYSGANCSISQVSGVISPAYINLSCKPGFNSDYYDFYFKLQYWSMSFFKSGKGISFDNRWTLNAETLLNYPIIIPTYEEQERIGAFLRNESKKIDELIKKQQEIIEDYQSLKKTVISESVTRGIRNNRKYKRTGYEWINELPEDWTTIPAKFLFVNSDERRREGDKQLTASQKHGILTQEEYMSRENAKIVLANQGLENWKHVEPNDFIISLRSFQGGLEMSDTTGCITWHYIVLKPAMDIEPRFYKWLFKSQLYIQALQRTCNFIRDGQDLRYSNFIKVPLYIPDIKEQEEIANYLDNKCREIDLIISQKEELIAELENYRRSMVFNYVTGKTEVPKA